MRRRHVFGEQLRRHYQQGDPKRHGNNDENHPGYAGLLGRKIRNPPPDIRRISTGYPPDIRRRDEDLIRFFDQ